MNLLQFGIDLGRVIAQTEYGTNPTDLGNAAQKIIDVLGVPMKVSDDPTLCIALGFGCADRDGEPIDEVALDLMGKTGLR